MGTHFQQDFPLQFHQFLLRIGAVPHVQDYLADRNNLNRWRTQLLLDFFPDEGNQPMYPAFELLRASYESLTVSRASRRREVKPVRHVYDPDVTPQLPQHQAFQPRDPPAAPKSPARRAPVASA